ncbi:hypothetical protein D3C77_595700 [compost metagenome]
MRITDQTNDWRRIEQLVIAQLLEARTNFPDFLVRILLCIVLKQIPCILFNSADQLIHLHADQSAFCAKLIHIALDLHLNTKHHFHPLDHISDLLQSNQLFKFKGGQIR